LENTDLSLIKNIAILEVARRLGIKVKGKRAMCFGGHDTDPSLCFVPSKNIWKCFGCDQKGDSIALVMEVLGCDFKEALNWFAREFGVSCFRNLDSLRSVYRTLARNPGSRTPSMTTMLTSDKKVFEEDPQVYAWLIDKCGEVVDAKGIAYLKRHGIPINIANRFIVRELKSPARALTHLVKEWGAKRIFQSGLVWGDEVPVKLIWDSYTLLFPFLQNGEVIYIQGRPLAGTTKFVGLRGIRKPLYNTEGLASLSKGASVYLCEGIPDALALEARELHALAVLGASSFRPEWVDLLHRYQVVIVPDGDSGGRTFVKMVSNAFRKGGKAIHMVRMPEGRDAADVLGDFEVDK
jgi:DNA primase